MSNKKPQARLAGRDARTGEFVKLSETRHCWSVLRCTPRLAYP